FLYALVRNRALNELRHEQTVYRHALNAVSDAQSPPPVDRSVLAAEIAQKISRVLATLPMNAQRAYRLRTDDEMSYREIAEAMGLAVKRIEALLADSRRALREGLAEFL